MTYRDLPAQPYSVAQAAHVLGISQDTILAMVHDGRLKGAFRSGKRLFKIPVEAVTAYMAKQTIAAP